MPYLVQHRKDKLDRGLLPTTPGDLTYLVVKALLGPAREIRDAIGKAVKAYCDRRTQNFALFAEVLGALRAAEKEHARRSKQSVPIREHAIWVCADFADWWYGEVVAPYEDDKIATNGDVY